MTLRVRLFALAKETVGAEACAVELPEAGTVADLKNVLASSSSGKTARPRYD